MVDNFRKLWAAKAENFLKVNHDRFHLKPEVSGKPYIIFVDPFNGCNLRCPECLHSLWPDRYPPGRMSLDLFRTIMHEYGGTAISLGLYDYGEPFLNRDVYEMVRIAKTYGIHTTISSNLNACDPRKIVECGLDNLVMSIDGATQETYQIYRRKGRLDKVLSNIKAIVKEKKRTGSTTPLLYWQFLTFEHNHHEIETARKLASDLEVNHFYTGTPQISSQNTGMKAWTNSKSTTPPIKSPDSYTDGGAKLEREPCRWLWQAITITATGDVFPCCVLWEPEAAFFNILEQKNISGLFNCERFQQVRRFFTGNQPFPYGEHGNPEKIVCPVCNDTVHQVPFTHCETCTYFQNTYVNDSNTIARDLAASLGLPYHALSHRISTLQDSLMNRKDSDFDELMKEVKAEMEEKQPETPTKKVSMFKRMMRFYS